jgi:hypothetical protein
VSAQSNRAAICEQETSATNPAKAGTDPGNRFTVGFFSYTSFEAVAEPLAGPEPT